MQVSAESELVYFTVGPTQSYPTIKAHIHEALVENVASKSHTGEFFTNTYSKLVLNLKKLFGIPDTHHIFFTGSSTESMHTIVASTAKKYTTHLVTAGFSEKFYKAAVDLGKEASAIKLDITKLTSLLELSIPQNAELLCITENETSLGFRTPLQELPKLKEQSPGMIIAVDVVSSAPYVTLDFSSIDIAFFSSHKGFSLPAGLGVMIVSDTAIAKAKSLREQGTIIGGHHSLASLAEKASNFKTPETPNVLTIYLLEKLTTDLLEVGIDKIRTDTEKKAALIYSYFDSHPRYKPLVNGEQRSITTPVIDVKGEAKRIVGELAQKGYIVSAGYRPNEENYIRIANFPAHSVENATDLLKTFDQID